jgi:hypothetical protein
VNKLSQIYIPYVNPIYLRGNTKDEDDAREMPCMNKKKFARSYVPRQPYMRPYPLSEGLKKGTIFPNLDMPYNIKSKE